INAYCEKTVGWAPPAATTPRKLFVCSDLPNKPDCSQLDSMPIKDAAVDGTSLVAGKGLMYQTRDLLEEAVKRVINNKPIYAGPGDDKGTQIIQLVQIAPYPLYQAINAAAVYPASAMDLLDSMSLLVAESLAYSYADE